jgi:superfamily II DNA/RNA helicase
MGCDRVAEQLRDAGVLADALHGGMTQGARTATLGDFKDGYVNVLVATDVAARGIHVDDVDLVLNVDPAGDHKDYLHRSGRTARAGRSGTVVTLILPHQRRGAFRLLEDAGVEATRHIVGGAFDADLIKITGARSLSEVQAESVATQAKQAEKDVQELTRELERATKHAADLRADAERLAARAARERAELGIEDEPVGQASAEALVEATVPAQSQAADVEDSRPVRTTSVRDERGRDSRDSREGRSFERRDDRGDDRGGERGGFQRRDDRPSSSGSRSYGDRDNRSGGGGFQRRDDRGGERGGERGGFQRRDDRPSSSGSRSYGDRDNRSGGGGFQRRDDRPSYGGSRPSYGDRDNRGSDRGGERGGFQRRDDRPSFGERSGRPSSPYKSRDDRSGGGSSRPAFGRRDDHRPASGGGRSFGDRDSRPGGFQRRDDRPSFGGGDRNKPRWKN